MNKLYIYRGILANESRYIAYVKLLKVLYRLEIIDESTALSLITEFHEFFV
jgi:hypothetical protein